LARVEKKVAKRMAEIAATLAVAYFLLLFAAALFQNHLIFFPQIPGRLTGDWRPVGLPVEDVWLTTEDGVKLHAWWIAAQEAEFTFLAFHGNAANIANRADVYSFLHTLPVNVLAVEYRGYGRSEGTPTETGIYRDADAAYLHVTRERGVRPRRVIAFGQSLGSAPAADLAARREVGGVVLEAPFCSAAAVARRLYWFLPGLSLLLRAKFATGDKLAQIHTPVLVVHCAQDPVIPFPLGQEVYALARPPRLFFGVNGYCHEEASLVDPNGYRARLMEFFKAVREAGGENVPPVGVPGGP
jgi:fermentation-respiration switch protein FrsA (DUF1100 family)